MTRALWIVWLLASPLASTVHAQSSEEIQARQLYLDGVQAYEQGRFSEALKLFTQGYRLSARRGFLWNMAEAAYRGGDIDTARNLYQRYLQEVPDGAKRAEAHTRLVEIEARTKSPPLPTGYAKTPTSVVAVEPQNVRATRPTGPSGDSSRPIWTRSWFVATLGAVVIGGVVAALLVTTGESEPSTLCTPEVECVPWR